MNGGARHGISLLRISGNYLGPHFLVHLPNIYFEFIEFVLNSGLKVLVCSLKCLQAVSIAAFLMIPHLPFLGRSSGYLRSSI